MWPNQRPAVRTTYLRTVDLIVAAEQGRLDEVRDLVDVCVIDSFDETNSINPLLAACSRGHIDVASLLLEKGANPNVRNVEGITPLYVSAKRGFDHIVSLLLGRYPGAKKHLLVDAKSSLLVAASSELTPLMIAAKEGHLTVCEILIEEGSPVRQCGARRFTPLHYAAQNGHLEVVRLLIERGASSDFESHVGTTAIFLAAKEGHSAVVHYLLAVGADATIGTKAQGGTPIGIAAYNGHLDVVRILCDSSKVGRIRKQQALYAAAYRDDVPMAILLVDHDCEPLRPPSPTLFRKMSSLAPVNIRAERRQEVRALLEERDFGQTLRFKRVERSEQTFTPLFVACEWGNNDVANFLMYHCFKEKPVVGLQRREYEDLTEWCYQIACQTGNIEYLRFLNKNFFEILERATNGLKLAAQNGHIDVVYFLLSNLPHDRELMNSLSIAAYFKRIDCLRVLTDHVSRKYSHMRFVHVCSPIDHLLFSTCLNHGTLELTDEEIDVLARLRKANFGSNAFKAERPKIQERFRKLRRESYEALIHGYTHNCSNTLPKLSVDTFCGILELSLTYLRVSQQRSYLHLRDL